jgi:hypothetical protein
VSKLLPKFSSAVGGDTSASCDRAHRDACGRPASGMILIAIPHVATVRHVPNAVSAVALWFAVPDPSLPVLSSLTTEGVANRAQTVGRKPSGTSPSGYIVSGLSNIFD